jgi:Porin subfamily/DcaP outer membrane protein
MTRKRNIGNVAAIGGATAVIALLTGLSGARADELADLRANQQLLQQRIDQLAQAQAQGGPPAPLTGGSGGGQALTLGYKPAPTSPSLGGSFPRSFLIPGTDTSLRVGGFVDITGLYYLQGNNASNPGTPSSNSGQNGNLSSIPLGEGFIPGAANGGVVAQSANHSRSNGVYTTSPQQSRLDIETRTPTAWGESRTFFSFDWAGGNGFSALSVQQAGGDSLIPRLRFAYGTLGGFLGGQALSNFSDADADTESMEFGGTMGSTGGNRIPQVRYTLAGPYGSAFSVSAEQPVTGIIVPSGTISNDQLLASSPNGATSVTAPLVPAGSFCNGVPCTGSGISATTTQFNPAQTRAPNLTAASYWSQPWGHVDFSGIIMPLFVNDGRFFSQNFLGYGGHFSGDVHPGWFGWQKDDFLFSAVVGEALGTNTSGGLATAFSLASNFSVATSCATPTPTCTGLAAASNVIVKPIFGYSMAGGYQHWWLPNLRSTIAAGNWQQAVSSQVIGPTEANSANKQLYNAFVNLVWNPVAFITTGIEYMYGRRFVVSNSSGSEHVLIAKWRVAF